MKTFFSLGFLLLATLVVSFGTGTDAQGSYTINAVRIYVNPDMVPPSEDGTPNEFAGARKRYIGDKLPEVADFSEGTLSIDDGGVLIDTTNDWQSSSAYTAETDDIIAITFKVTRTSGSDVRHGSVISLGGWFTGGPTAQEYEPWSGNTYIKVLYPSRYIEARTNVAVNVTTPYSFTVVYAYRVRQNDMHANGNWLVMRDGDKPFQRWTGALNATYTGTIYYPRIDGSAPSTLDTIAPKMLPVSSHPIRFTDSSGNPLDYAPRVGRSRYHEIRQNCLEHHEKYHTDYTDACALVTADGWSKPALTTSRQVGYYGPDDTIYVSIKFNESVMIESGKEPTLREFAGGTFTGGMATYHTGSGTDTLVFKYEVQEGDSNYGEIELWSGLRHNYDDVHNPPDYTGRPGNVMRLEDPRARWIRDLAYNRLVERWSDTRNALLAYFRNDKAHLGAPGSKTTNFLVDTIPATVWIPGVIKNGVTHREDRRIAVVNLDATYTDIPAMTADDFRAAVTESDVQAGAFDVEFRFFNMSSAADEVGTSFTGDDVEITGENVVRDEWNVEIAYVGLDHRSIHAWPPPNHWSGNPQGSLHSPGQATNSASFLVYKATITPPLGFQGDVAISLPAGATQDIAGNDSLASNTLTVPVNIPFQVVETPEIVKPAAGVYTVGEKIEVEVTYNREGLRYVGDNPPYLTLYLGEEVPANARHAVWTAQEDVNSTKVTFTYTVAANDVATSLRVAEEIGLTVPSDTRLVDATGSQLSGTGERAKGSGEGLEKLPTAGQPLPLEDTSGRQVSPVVSDTPVVPYTPIFEETAPKAAASDVPRSPIVFNELGNGSGDADDWLEFRNVTGSAVSLKDWELSIVQDGKQEDTSLIAFVEDVSVPANGLLLITNSDPTAEGNVLAGGDDVATSAVETKGSSHLYLVNAGLSLPDDGKFLLILRNAKEKLGLNEAFVDVAGGGGSDTDAFVREQTGDYDTHVWPLQVLQAPGGDTEDALGSGTVWQRANAGVVGYHKEAWAESAFTGLGYDRQVSKSAATSGTPGYPNGAVKTEAATPKGSITLSEIMVDSAGGTLPQWIELYNKSKTDAINLNRWKLELQNVDSEDLVSRPIVTLTLGEKVIQPNQTLLIVAGPARASSDSYLPADRVYDLLALHEKNLRIKRARDTFLSTEGFYLKLTDRNENLVDEVGNRDSDRRSDDAPAWALPMSSEAGSRSSLIRRYDNGVARPGQKRASWVLAARIKPFDERLHYGHAEDIGTPGHREGGALPVELSSFAMTRTEAGAVVLTWITESEVDNAGFNLRRSEKRANGFTLLNPALIAGAGTTGERQTYTFTDTSAKPGVEYYYQIEEVSFDGKPATLVTRLLPGPVSAANRMLTTFGALKKRD